MSDYLPKNDAELDAWATNFDAVLMANPVAYGETTTTATAFDTIYGTWHDAYEAHLAKQIEAEGFSHGKDTARDTMINAIRAVVRRLQIAALMTDAKRASLGITVRDTTSTGSAAPASIPVLSVDTSFRLRHTINFADQGTPTSKAKPAGVASCEIWTKVGGPPPGDVSDCTYLATDTKTPYVHNFDSTEAGQTVHYMARWLSTRGEPGPWAETVSATVGA